MARDPRCPAKAEAQRGRFTDPDRLLPMFDGEGGGGAVRWTGPFGIAAERPQPRRASFLARELGEIDPAAGDPVD